MAFSTLMVHLALGGANEFLLGFTSDLARRLRARQVIGIAGGQPLQIYGEGGMYFTADIVEQDRVEIEKELKEAEARFRAILDGSASHLEWRSTITYSLIAEYIAQEMRAADLLITGPSLSGSILDTTRRVLIADLVMRTGKPVLIVHPETKSLVLENVLVAWKDSRESRRAIEDALPLLKMAARVTVVEIATEDDMSDARRRIGDVVSWLERHDIAASGETKQSTGDDAVQLGAIGQELSADLMVAGAYGHNRLREWVLGGVTRDLLLRPSRCSFVSH